MKSIKDTLTLIHSIVNKIRETVELDIALVGGYAVIAHGISRTTIDVDFLVYSETAISETSRFISILKTNFPEHFESKWVEATNSPDEPFPYDILFLTDRNCDYPRMDFIIPRYKWELEGLKKAYSSKELQFPLMPIPYLIAMKLRAGSPKDNYDVLELFQLLSDQEKKETFELAKQINKERYLSELLTRNYRRAVEPENPDQLLR